jgi:hypothetical protein
MYGLKPSARKHQQMLLQCNNQQRRTRQIDTSNKRQTFNSRNEKLLDVDQDLAKKKKQKIQQNIDSTNNETKTNDYEEDTFEAHSNNVDKENLEFNTSIPTDSNHKYNNMNESNSVFGTPHVMPVNVTSSFIANGAGLHAENNTSSVTANGAGLNEKKLSVSTGILGEGHISILHAYVRDDLFKNIKILAPNHLETKGEIMTECLKLLKYSETRNGNLTAFANACRAEIRKTMCSRRGYVKRQTGLTIEGKKFFQSFFIFNINIFHTVFVPNFLCNYFAWVNKK